MLVIESRGRQLGGDSLWRIECPTRMQEPEKWTNGIPTHWVEQTAAQGKLSAAAQRVFEADNPIHKHLQN